VADYLKNVWYMAGWSEELTDGIMSRRLFDRPIAFFRTSDGAVKAIADRCPHRFAPLSMGDKIADTIQCPYHGLTFDGTGACVRNPFSEKIPAAAKVDAWACLEQDGIIWLWGGDSASADPAKIPDFGAVADRPDRKVLRGYTLINAPYEYCTDNLMDLSHIEFVHRGTFAGDGVIFAGTHEVISEGDTLHSNWWMPGTEGQLVDHWLDMRWNAPASMKLKLGATLPGHPREQGYEVGGQAHIVTPATATTSHYFTANARHEAIDDPGVDAFLTQLFAKAFDEEDKPVIEAAFANLEGMEFWEAKPISLGIDQGGTRARRMLESMIAKEAALG
jgi:phenylpropionate dioxygenase-like ring-hydroxylating dioxygenase large terminal subunit